MRKFLKILGILLLLALVAAQFVPVERTNPPIDRAQVLVAPAEVDEILNRSCYDCHSHATQWPWYAHVAPASWLLARDVEEGRKHLNFSIWGTYTSNRRDHKLEEIVEMTSSGQMPLWFYVPLHPEAKLSEADVATLKAWSDAERARLAAEDEAEPGAPADAPADPPR